MPPVRTWLFRVLGGRFREAAMPNPQPPGKGPVVDGDYETVDPDAERMRSEIDPPTEPKAGPMPPPRGGWDDKP